MAQKPASGAIIVTTDNSANLDLRSYSADFQLNEILKELGGFKKYQLRYCFLVSLPIILMACHVTGFVFTVSVPEYRCAIPECETGQFIAPWLNFTTPREEEIEGISYDSCKRYGRREGPAQCTPSAFDQTTEVYCDTWVYSDDNSIVSEFDLGCNQWKHTFVGTMNSIGSLLGTFVSGMICDIYGRKTVLISGMVLSGLSGIARIFSPEYWTFVALEFLTGFFVFGVFNVSVIMCVEIVEPKHRVLATMFSCYTYALGEVLLGGFSWMFPYWKTIQAIFYLPAFLFILYIWYVPESLRWLLGEHKLQEITRIIEEVARVNKIQLNQETMKNFYNTIEKNQSMSDLNKSQNSIDILVQIAKSKVLLFRTICCSMWFLLTSFVYFGLTFNPAMLSGNMYLNFILVALVEVPGYTMYYYVAKWYGRKTPMMISYLLTGSMCIGFIFVPEGMLWLNIVLFLFGKFFITIAYTIVFIYAAELFPTFMRGSVIGICSLLGGIGVILAPQIPLLSAYMESLPFLLFGGSAILCGITSMIFPETSNVQLPDTVQDAENIGKKVTVKTIT